MQQTTVAERSKIEANVNCLHLMLQETFPNDDYDNNKRRLISDTTTSHFQTDFWQF